MIIVNNSKYNAEKILSNPHKNNEHTGLVNVLLNFVKNNNYQNRFRIY